MGKMLTVEQQSYISQPTLLTRMCSETQIIQQPTSFSSYHNSRPGSPTSRGCELVAWAFLKLKGSKGPILGDLRIQLYHYVNRISESK